jgi:ribonuclease HI
MHVGYPNANSGQMEIFACIDALRESGQLHLPVPIKKVVVFTDSKYVCENYIKAMFDWSANKWFRKTGAPVPDAHLWKDLNSQIKKWTTVGAYVEIVWVKGHGVDRHNKAVHKMEKKASELPLDKVTRRGPISIFQPRKVIQSRKLEIGIVKMQNQKISIKILSCKLLKPQNLWCYQYQVVSPNNPFLGLVDQIISEKSLDVIKTYYVKFNSVAGDPRITNMYWEIK